MKAGHDAFTFLDGLKLAVQRHPRHAAPPLLVEVDVDTPVVCPKGRVRVAPVMAVTAAARRGVQLTGEERRPHPRQPGPTRARPGWRKLSWAVAARMASCVPSRLGVTAKARERFGASRWGLPFDPNSHRPTRCSPTRPPRQGLLRQRSRAAHRPD